MKIQNTDTEIKLSQKRKEITKEELRALTNVIYNKYGIDFTNYEIKSLTRGFARIINKYKFESLIDLWSLILKDRKFLDKCIDDLTVNLTEFFRNDSLWLWLKNELPLQHKNNQSLKVWHAACASGEEVYSFAFLLKRLGFENFQLHGTDLSKSSIEKAKNAEYTAVFFRKYEKALKTIFPNASTTEMFIDKGSDYKIQPELQIPTSFSISNLIQEEYGEVNDIVFCRNVMIYFDTDLKVKILEKLHRSLISEGMLIIGYYDSLPEGVEHLFKPLSSQHKVFIKVN